MKEHFRQIWIEKWIASILQLLQQIDKDGVEKYFHYIGSNSNLTVEYLDKHLKDKIGHDKYYNCISSNPHLTFEYVTEHIDEAWDWKALSRHPNITFDMILATHNNPKYKWCICEMSANPSVTCEILTTHPLFANMTEHMWDLIWHNYCLNPNATFTELKTHVLEYSMGCGISLCQSVTLDDVFANPEIPWSVHKLLENPNIGKNITTKNILKLAEMHINFHYRIHYGYVSAEKMNNAIDKKYKSLQDCVTSLYGTPNEVKKLDKTRFDEQLRNPHLQISDLYENNRIVKQLYVFYVLENNLSCNCDNFISTQVSLVLLASMHDGRSWICHETKAECILADEWMMSHVMKYV